MDEAPTILILDDDPAYCEAMSAYLESNGCRVTTIQEPNALDAALLRTNPDLLLLDQRLGSTTGTNVLLRIREMTSLPCIIVTGRSDAVDRIVNLEVGADDEVEKAIPPREMLARIRSVLRRSRATTLGARVTTAPAAICASGWEFSVQRRELRRPDGSLCSLTTAEFEALRALHDAAGAAVSRSDLSERVFRRPYDANDRAVDTVIRKLRRKIDEPDEPRVIKTVRPVGYMFAGFLDEARG